MSTIALPDWAKTGHGYGYGYGYGYGHGYGYGYGDGYGDGYGYGDGHGHGYGYGDGYALVDAYADHPTVTEHTADGSQVVLGLWKSDQDGQPVNGGRHGEPARPGLIQETVGPLKICTSHALHADTNPASWTGDRWWIVALFVPVQRVGTKIGSLKRLIVEELK